MPGFRYTAIEPDGTVAQGTMEAPDAAAVIAQLQRQGRLPVRAEPEAATSFLAQLLSTEFGRRRGVRRGELTELTRELSVMMGAGQDLDRALRFLVDTAPNGRVRAVMASVRDAVRDGAPLHAAMGRHERSFPRLFLGMVRAGEAGGALAATLERLADLLERERALIAALQSALIYPALLVVTAVGSITLLLTQVLPQFVPLFEQNGATLPASTQFMIGVGNAVSAWGLYALLILAVLSLTLRQALRQPAPRLRWDRLLLHLPVLGSMLREILAARFTRTLGTLLVNGVPLVAALGTVRDTLGNQAGVEAVEAATRAAKGGAGLSGALAAAAVFPPRTVHLLRLGEDTAQLGPLALRAAAIHEETARRGLQRLVSLLVPAITVIMGGAVAAIVVALLSAMLSLNDLAG